MSGTVTVNGTAAEDAEVSSQHGYTATTNASGGYELNVPSGSVNVTADPFGWESANNSTTIGADETLSNHDVTVTTSTVDYEIIDRPAPFARPADNVSMTLRVANADTYNMTLLPGPNAGNRTGDISVLVDGTEYSDLENIPLSGADDFLVNVTVVTADGFYGMFALQHNLTAGADTQIRKTGISRVHPDPVVVPSHVDPGSLQEVHDFVEPLTTIQLNESRTENLNSSSFGLLFNKPLTLTAANESSSLDFDDDYGGSASTAGIQVLGPTRNLTISNVTIDGDGVDQVISSVDAEASIENNTIRNGEIGIVHGGGLNAPSISGNDVDEVSTAGIVLQGAATNITHNEIGQSTPGGPTDGVIARDAFAVRISDNDIAATSNGISLLEPASSVTSANYVSGNSITNFGDTGIYVNASAAAGAVFGNYVEGGEAGIVDEATTTISSNVVYQPSTVGIYSSHDGVTLNGNWVGESERGVHLVGAHDARVENTTVVNATFSGVDVERAQNVTVDGLEVPNLDSSADSSLGIVDSIDVTVSAVNASDDGIHVLGSDMVSVTNVTVHDSIDGVWVYGDNPRQNANIAVNDANFRNVSVPIRIDDGGEATVENGMVLEPAASGSDVRLQNVDPTAVAISNFTFANGTTIDASGQNVSVQSTTDPSSGFPDGHSAIETYLDIVEDGSNGEIELNASYDAGDVSGLRESSLAIYRYNTTSANWDEVSKTGVNTSNQDVWASLDSFSTFAPLAEEAQDNFSVTSIESNTSTVLQGDTIQVNATINNTGDETGTQNVSLDVDGGVGTVDHTNVTIDAGNETTVSLNWTTESGDAGDYNATVSSANDSATEGVTVQKPANFSVTLDETNAPVTEGENLTVDATIENVGDVSGNQTVNLSVDGRVGEVANTSVSLGAGTSTTETFQWTTTEGDAGEYNATVNSGNDSATTDVTVQTPANFSVNVTGTNSPVDEGETLQVNATIDNTGDVEATQNVTLEINDTGIEDHRNVTLGGGNGTNVTLDWTPRGQGNGTHTATVSSADANDSEQVVVNDTATYFEVTSIDPETPITEGDSYTVEANVTNYGTSNATQNVTYLLGGSVAGTETNVNLTANESTTLTFENTNGTPGEYTQAIETANEIVPTDNLTVNEDDSGGDGPVFIPAPPSGDEGPSTDFSLSSFAVAPPEAAVGQQVTVEARVDNDGEDNGDFTATLTANGEAIANRTVEVNANYYETVTLSTAFDEAGTYDLAVNDEAAGTVTVTQGAGIVVSDLQFDATDVQAGETVTATATVTNDGNVENSRDVALTIGGETVGSQSVTLGAGESETVTFEHTFAESGSYDVALDGEQVRTVDVAESQTTGGDDDGDGGTFGGFPILVLVALLGVLIAAGSVAVYVYGDELGELLEE